MSFELGRLAEFRAAEKALAQQVAEFEALRNSPDLKRELEFERDLSELLGRYKMSRSALLEYLQVETGAAKKAGAASPTRRKAPTFKDRTYLNPHTGQKITIRLGNNATFRAWCDEYGRDTVDGWLVNP